jgi:hypothetical protein
MPSHGFIKVLSSQPVSEVKPAGKESLELERLNVPYAGVWHEQAQLEDCCVRSRSSAWRDAVDMESAF